MCFHSVSFSPLSFMHPSTGVLAPSRDFHIAGRILMHKFDLGEPRHSGGGGLAEESSPR